MWRQIANPIDKMYRLSPIAIVAVRDHCKFGPGRVQFCSPELAPQSVAMSWCGARARILPCAGSTTRPRALLPRVRGTLTRPMDQNLIANREAHDTGMIAEGRRH